MKTPIQPKHIKQSMHYIKFEMILFPYDPKKLCV